MTCPRTMCPTKIPDPWPMCPPLILFYYLFVLVLVLFIYLLSEYTYQWNALPPIPGARWEIGGELTCPNGTSPHTWGTILHTIPLHISYKYSISPCCRQCVTGRYGCLDATIPTKYPPLREDSDGKSPSFSNISPRYSRWVIPLDKLPPHQ